MADIWKLLENLPTKYGYIGKTMVHELSQCQASGQWRIIFCSDFGYTEPIFGDTALEAVKKGIEFLNEPETKIVEI